MKNFDFSKSVFSTPKFTGSIPQCAGQKGAPSTNTYADRGHWDHLLYELLFNTKLKYSKGYVITCIFLRQIFFHRVLSSITFS